VFSKRVIEAPADDSRGNFLLIRFMPAWSKSVLFCELPEFFSFCFLSDIHIIHTPSLKDICVF
jgi:hypothetical protein